MTNAFLNTSIPQLVSSFQVRARGLTFVCTQIFSSILHFTTAAKKPSVTLEVHVAPRINMRLETKVTTIANAGNLTLATDIVVPYLRIIIIIIIIHHYYGVRGGAVG
jgi:hypothetical protein